VEVQRHAFLTALEGGEWSASRSGRFTLRAKSPVYLLEYLDVRKQKVQEGNISRMNEIKNECIILVGMPQERTKCRWEDNIKMDRKELMCKGHGLY